MSDIRQAHKALVARIVAGDGRASSLQRRSAFDDDGELAEAVRVLVEKVAKRAHEVTDDDIAAAKASGLSEDQVFEIVVCAAVGQATRQHESALEALAAVAGRV